MPKLNSFVQSVFGQIKALIQFCHIHAICSVQAHTHMQRQRMLNLEGSKWFSMGSKACGIRNPYINKTTTKTKQQQITNK